MQEFDEDFYAILGVDESATPEEIRKAYLTLAKKLHPDRYPNDPDQRALAQTEFAKVTRAHDIVSDSQRRTEYDTLRELKRNRTAKPEVASEPEPLHLAQARKWQAQTTTDEENINTKWANKHLTRAEDLFRRKRYQEAETAMKEAIRLVPQEARYHNKLAEIYLARGWKTLAMTEVQAALRANPRDNEAKVLEVKIRNLTKTSAQTTQKMDFLTQLKNLFSGKKR